MLRICRAEDGKIVEVELTLWDIERDGNLERFLQDKTGVDQDAVLAYLLDGSRLTTENIRDLAGAQDETIYVFNKLYLDYELHEVLRELRTQPHLQPPIEETISSTPPFRPYQLAAGYLQIAHVHRDTVSDTASSIHQQSTALGIASRNLDLHILALSEAFESFAEGARQALANQRLLLTTLETDLAAVATIRIHPVFLKSYTRKKIEAGEERPRTLGDYVDDEKMRYVAQGCAKTNDGLALKFEQAQECMNRLTEGADQVRTTLQTNRILESTDLGERRAHDAFEKISDIASRIDTSTSGTLLPELKQADRQLRDEVESIADTKNLSTELCIGALRRISVLNEDLMLLPNLISTLQVDLRARNSFAHIQRLHKMIYAYGATLVEIVRRKEFSRFFYQRAQTILEAMAKLTSAERRRRQIYRGDVHGQLPFETRGLDDSVPTIDFSPTGGKDVDADHAYALERADVDAFMQVLDEIDWKLRTSPLTSASSLAETRAALNKLIDKMNGIESSFDRIVERSLISSSRLSLSRRRLTEADEAAYHELSERVTTLEREKHEREDACNKDREQYEAEIARLKADLQTSSEMEGQEYEKIETLTREVHSLKVQNESDCQARKILEQRHAELLADVEALRKGQADASAEATNRTHEAETLRLELSQTREENEEVKKLEATHAKRVEQLISDQTETLRSLAEARGRGEDLRAQIDVARAENAAATQALKEASEQKEQLLRAQAIEHDRIMRDHIAEADGDRAVLEQQSYEARAQLDEKERQLKGARAEIELLNADAIGLREELQRTEHELREARHVERVLRNDLSQGRASQSDFEQKITDRDRLVAQILDVAIAFRDCHTKTLVTLQPLSVHPATATRNGVNPSESVVLSPPRLPMSPLREEATPIDPTDPAAALEILRSYDLDSFSETVAKVASVVRKWQKQCKEYRERAKGKITFRNFAKGDLALFLPTRNSVSKPWAAFNVSFPHFFLNATGRLAEQLKSREWIVARITSISERIVDARDPNSNPYGLGDGVKYYMLDVEDWTKPGADAAKRRKSSTKQITQVQLSSSPPLERPISPPLDDSAENASSAAEPLGPTRSPNSHLFPVRSRSNSTSAGPSSLSRLLAQATPGESQLETIPATPPGQSRSRTPSPSPHVNGPPPPSPSRVQSLAHSPPLPSPLRPGSRASSSSRLSFSGGRLAPFPKGPVGAGSTSKAAATTALSENPVNAPATPSTSVDKHERYASNPMESSTPSPTQSYSEGLSNILSSRRRTTSEHVLPTTLVKISKRSPTNPTVTSKTGPTTATSALANLLPFGMTMSLGRRKKVAVDSAFDQQTGPGQSTDNLGSPVAGEGSTATFAVIGNANEPDAPPPTPATDLLKKFDYQ